MDDERLDSLADVAADPSVDLPRGRAELELLARFVERNPGFDPGAADEELERLRSAPEEAGLDLPERSADRERLLTLLQRHGDVDVLRSAVTMDDAGAPGGPQPDQFGADATDGAPADTEAAEGLFDQDQADKGDEDDWVSYLVPDDEDLEEMDDLGTQLGVGAGLGVCLAAVAAALWSGITISVGSMMVFAEVQNLPLVLGVVVAGSLALGAVVGGVFRWSVDDPIDAYRRGVALPFAAVPFVGMVLLLLVQFFGTVVVELVALDLLGAVVDLVVTVIVVAIVGLFVLVGLMIGVGAVVWLPALAGITLGTLLVSPTDVIGG